MPAGKNIRAPKQFPHTKQLQNPAAESKIGMRDLWDFSRNFLTAPVRPHRGGLLFAGAPRERPVLSWHLRRRKQAPADGAQQAVSCPLPERRGSSLHIGLSLCAKTRPNRRSAKMAQAQKTPLNRNIERCSADFQPGNLVRSGESRTHGLLNPIQARYKLRYTRIRRRSCNQHGLFIAVGPSLVKQFFSKILRILIEARKGRKGTPPKCRADRRPAAPGAGCVNRAMAHGNKPGPAVRYLVRCAVRLLAADAALV